MTVRNNERNGCDVDIDLVTSEPKNTTILNWAPNVVALQATNLLLLFNSFLTSKIKTIPLVPHFPSLSLPLYLSLKNDSITCDPPMATQFQSILSNKKRNYSEAILTETSRKQAKLD